MEVRPGIDLSKSQFKNKIAVKMAEKIKEVNPIKVIILSGLTENDEIAVSAVLVIANKSAVLFPDNLGSLSYSTAKLLKPTHEERPLKYRDFSGIEFKASITFRVISLKSPELLGKSTSLKYAKSL